MSLLVWQRHANCIHSVRLFAGEDNLHRFPCSAVYSKNHLLSPPWQVSLLLLHWILLLYTLQSIYLDYTCLELPVRVCHGCRLSGIPSRKKKRFWASFFTRESLSLDKTRQDFKFAPSRPFISVSNTLKLLYYFHFRIDLATFEDV